MQLTRSDASAVHSTGKLVGALDRDLISGSELVNALFDNFYGCETDSGIEQCVAVIPKRLWSEIECKVSDTLKRTHPGDLFVYHPITLTETELEDLDKRVRRTMAVVSSYLANPTGVVEYEIDDPDGMRQQWFLFKHFDTVVGEECRTDGCSEDRVRNSVFCRAHHFEMIYRQSPPDATEQSDEPKSR